MPCPLCGDICRCSSDAYSAASPRWRPDAEASPPAAPLTPGLESAAAEAPSRPAAVETAVPERSHESAPQDSPAWRREVATRLTRYQARRKPRPPRYPSLRLRFEDEGLTSAANGPQAHLPALPQAITTASHQALALDRFADSLSRPVERQPSYAPAPHELPALDDAAALLPAGELLPLQAPPAPAPTTGKIIEFPRSWTPPPDPLDALAEPVMDRPRILEAPEVVPPPPALGGIMIEPAQQPELEKRPGIDFPLQSAPLARRICAAAIDAAIIAAAGAVFGVIFWKLAAIRPPRFQIIGLAAGLGSLFWAAYQYLLVVYSGSTPGLRLAGLELARFDGRPARRSLRRWRVLASFLSAISLGMGYAWVFLDEDALCWHDRITHTYLAPKR